VNWCPASLTALSDEEVVMKEQQGFLYYFKVEIAEEPGTFSRLRQRGRKQFPATPPWPSIQKTRVTQNTLANKCCVRSRRSLPRAQKLIPIIGDEHVDFKFGTGVLESYACARQSGL